MGIASKATRAADVPDGPLKAGVILMAKSPHQMDNLTVL